MARVGTPSSAEDSLTEDRMALVELPRRAVAGRDEVVSLEVV